MRDSLILGIISYFIAGGSPCFWPLYVHGVLHGTTDELQMRSHIAGFHVVGVYDGRNSPLKVSFPAAILQDTAGRFWIGGDGEELLQVFDEHNNEWITFTDEETAPRLHYRPGAAFPYPLEEISQDAYGNLWFSSRSRISGKPIITTLNGSKWTRIELEKGAWDFQSVGMFSASKSALRVWLGDRVFNVERQHVVPFLNLSQTIRNQTPSPRAHPDETKEPEYEIMSAFEDRTGCIWFGTSKGIVRYTVRTSEIMIYNPTNALNVTRIYEAKDGKLWFANPRGQIHGYSSNRSWQSYDLFDHLPRAERYDAVSKMIISTRSILQDESGQILFGTDRGLLILDPATNAWSFYDAKNSGLPDSDVMSMTKDRVGRIWIGTRKGIVVTQQNYKESPRVRFGI